MSWCNICIGEIFFINKQPQKVAFNPPPPPKKKNHIYSTTENAKVNLKYYMILNRKIQGQKWRS